MDPQTAPIALPRLAASARDIKRRGDILPLRISIAKRGTTPHAYLDAMTGVAFRSKEAVRLDRKYRSEEHKQKLREQAEMRRILNATVVPAEEAGWVFSPDGLGYRDGYFEEADALLEYCAEADLTPPAYVYCTEAVSFQFDLAGAIESHLDDNHHEDAIDSLVDLRELENFFAAWMNKQTLRSYFYDYKRLVVLDAERFAQLQAEARAALGSDAP